MALSVSFSMVKLLAEELKATDYTLTQSSLDQVSEFDFSNKADLAGSHQFRLSSFRPSLHMKFHDVIIPNEIVITREIVSVRFR